MISTKFNTTDNILETKFEGTIKVEELSDYIKLVRETKTLPQELKILSDARKGKFAGKMKRKDSNNDSVKPDPQMQYLSSLNWEKIISKEEIIDELKRVSLIVIPPQTIIPNSLLTYPLNGPLPNMGNRLMVAPNNSCDSPV